MFNVARSIRKKWAKRQEPVCFYCGNQVYSQHPDPKHQRTVDHKRPTSRGGKDKRKNWAISCRRCNLLKADRTVEEFRQSKDYPVTTTLVKERVPWREARKVSLMVLSASQIDTAQLCLRKWWLERVRKMPRQESTQSQIVGTCLHGVLERYLEADELGRGRDGKPLELFPEGWHIVRNRFDAEKVDGMLDLEEQDKVRKLVTKAIEEGFIERRPGRIIEHKFELTVEGDFRLDGFIDLTYEPQGDSIEVVDHKTTKSRRWMKSPENLRENVQLTIYGIERLIAHQAKGLPLPDRVTYRHNYFCLDPKDLTVRKVEVTLPTSEVVDRWEKIRGLMGDMRSVRSGAEKNTDIIIPPEVMAKACQAYGGCQFRPICSGYESETDFESRMLSWEKGLNTLDATVASGDNQCSPQWASVEISQQSNWKGSGMSSAPGTSFAQAFAAKLQQPAAPQQPQQQAPAFAAPQAPQQPQAPFNQPTQFQQPQQQPVQQFVQQPAQSPPTVPVASPEQALAAAGIPVAGTITNGQVVHTSPVGQIYQGNPPWGDTSCQACNGVGFNTAGGVCQVCEHQYYAKGGDPNNGPRNFTFTAFGDGRVQWVRKSDGAAGVTTIPNWKGQAVAEQKAAFVQPAQQQPAQQAPVQPQQPAAQQQAPATSTTQAAPETPAKRGPGRPRKNAAAAAGAAPTANNSGEGFTLLLNTAVVSGADDSVLDAREEFNFFCGEMVKGTVFASYFDMDPFKRREVWKSGAESMARKWAGCIVVADYVGSHDPDFRHFLDAARSVASMVMASVNS